MPNNDNINQSAELELQLDGDFIGSAYSPQVEVTETADGHEVAITYEDAESGITTKTFDVVDGKDGADGYSPTARVEQLTDGARVTITDKDGTTQATINDGFSPTAQVSQGEGSATITITDKDGTTSATVYDGAQGPQGIQGPAGYSPTVAIESTAQAHTVTITDEDGAHSYTVPTYADEEQARADEWTELKGEAEAATDAANAAAESIERAYLPGTVVGGADGLMDDAQADQWVSHESESNGVARIESVQGAAVCWNQNARNNNTGATVTGITFTNNGDGSWTVDGTASAEAFRYTDSPQRLELTVGHKYLAKGCPTGGSASTYLYRDTLWRAFTDYGNGAIFTVAEGRQACTPSVVVANGATVDNLVFRPQLFDLTVMFGPGNEPNTVAEFQALYPEAYYPYSAPILNPVQIAGIRSTGRNLIDLNSPYGNGGYNKEAGYQINAETPSATPSGENPCVITIHEAWNSVTFVSAPLEVGQIYKFVLTSVTADLRATIYMLDANHVVKRRIGNYIAASSITSSPTVADGEVYFAIYCAANVATTLTITNVMLQVATADFNTYKPYMTDGVEWETQALRAAGSVADVLYNDHMDVRVGAYTFTGNENVYLEGWRPIDGYYACSIAYASIPNLALTDGFDNLRMAELDTISYEDAYRGVAGICEAPRATPQLCGIFVRVPASIAANSAQLLAWLAGKTLYYALSTPTTTPISPALSMTYKVEQGGVESIIVPAGEISAAPVWYISYAKSAAQIVADALAAIAAPDGPTATASHAVGSYLTMNGKLYKVTSAIVVGATIAEGVNVAQTTVMAEIMALQGTRATALTSSRLVGELQTTQEPAETGSELETDATDSAQETERE